MKKPRILVVGSLAMDLIVSAERFPNSGETVVGRDFETAPGGKGANQAVQAARLGADVTMFGKVGQDSFGEQLKASLKSAGVDISQIGTAQGTSTGVSNILLETRDGAAANRIICVPGANFVLSPEDVLPLRETIAGYDMVMLQLEIPLEVNRLVVQYAREKGVPVMLNSAPYMPVPDEMLAGLSYISPNEHEAALLTGLPITDIPSAKRAVDALRGKGTDHVLITMGSQGAVLGDEWGFYASPCIPDVQVQDPTAAGDSFVAAFCTAVCVGLPQEKALRFANYTASLTVSRMGAQPSLPTLREVLDQMKSRGESFPELEALDR